VLIPGIAEQVPDRYLPNVHAVRATFIHDLLDVMLHNTLGIGCTQMHHMGWLPFEFDHVGGWILTIQECLKVGRCILMPKQRHFIGRDCGQYIIEENVEVNSEIHEVCHVMCTKIHNENITLFPSSYAEHHGIPCVDSKFLWHLIITVTMEHGTANDVKPLSK